MIWLDIIDPKYVLFFKGLIPDLKLLDEVLITTRKSDGYTECFELLELFGLEAIDIGGYGGASLLGKFEKRLQRQKGFLELFEKIGIPKLFITGASVEGTQIAYGLGIPIVQFSDTPMKADSFSLKNFTLLSKLTLPLSSLVFRPFVVPEICYTALGIPAENVISYGFIDVALWLKDLPKGKDFRETYHIPQNKPSILIREEEYKAHYVQKKLPIIYESIELLAATLNVNLILMPRYESDYLKDAFGGLKNVYIIEEKLLPACFYPFIDILIGGGGTMNLEACYLGIPTISSRSLFLFHDRYLLENNLMKHCKSAQEVCQEVKKILEIKKISEEKNGSNPSSDLVAKAQKLFEPKNASFKEIFKEIKERFYA